MNLTKENFFKENKRNFENFKFLNKNCFNLKFGDKKIEKKFIKYLMLDSKNKRIFMNILCFMNILSRLVFEIDRKTYYIFFISQLILTIIAGLLFLLIYVIIEEYYLLSILHIILSTIFCIINSQAAIFSIIFKANVSEESKIKEFYTYLFFSILEILTSCEYNFIFSIFIFILNLIVSMLAVLQKNESNSGNILDMFFSSFAIIIIIANLKNNSYYFRQNYIKKYYFE